MYTQGLGRRQHHTRAAPELSPAEKVGGDDSLVALVEKVTASGSKKLNKTSGQRLAEACYAGLFIALAFVFYITVTTGSAGAPWGLVRLVGALAFSLGLTLVVLLQVELFTGTVLTAMPFVRGGVSLRHLLSVWGQVFAGNAVGALLMALLIGAAGVWHLHGGLWGINAIKTALYKLEHGFGEAFALGILCNLLVCLGIWLTHLTRSPLSKAILLALPVALFVSSGFEHSIANLFLLPLAWMLCALMPDALLLAHGLDQHTLSVLTPLNMLAANLIPVTLGNIVGGALFTGLGFLGVARLTQSGKTLPTELTSRQHQASAVYVSTPITTASQLPVAGEQSLPFAHMEPSIMNKCLEKMSVRDLLEPATTLTPSLNLWQALDMMNKAAVTHCPVVADGGRLVGMVGHQDVLRGLWAEEFSLHSGYRVNDLMSKQLNTVAPDDALSPLIEFWVVDRNTLFPVNSEGHWTGGHYQAYEERLRHAAATTPAVLPVVEAGVVKGVVRRERLIALLTSQRIEHAGEAA